MRNKAPKTRTFYRNRLGNGGVCLLCTGAVIIFLGYMVEDIEKHQTFLACYAFVMMMLFLVPALRFPFNGVVVTPTNIVVRNIMRTHALSWSDVERFELAKYDPWPRIGVAVLKSGRRVPMTGVPWAPLSHFAEKTVAALNERLASIQSGSEENIIPSLPVTRRHYRTRRNRLAYPIFVLGIPLCVLLVFAPRGGLPVHLTALVFTGAMLWLARNLIRLGIEVGDDGITVYGLRRQQVTWDQVAGLDTHRWSINTIVDVRLTDGRALNTNLIQGAPITWHGGKTKDIVSVLQAELDSRGVPPSEQLPSSVGIASLGST
jgi:hypothetical protein